MRQYFKYYKILLVAFCCFNVDLVVSQQYTIQNIAPSSLGKLAPQNWCVSQNSLQHVFIGNNKNIVVSNGTFWSEITVGNDAKVYDLLSNQKQVYVGAYEEFGVIFLNDKGAYVYQSFRALLKDSEKQIGPIIKVLQKGDEVFFFNHFKVFIYNIKNQSLTEVSLKNIEVEYAFEFDDKIIMYDHHHNKLFKLNRDLKSQPFLDIPNSHLVVAVKTFKNKLYILFDHDFIHVYNKNLELVEQKYFDKQFCNQVFTDFEMIGDKILLASKKGLFLFDQNQTLLQHYDQSSGLRDNHVTDLFMDKAQNIWLTLNNGVSVLKPKLNPSLQKLNAKNSLQGLIEDVTLFDDDVYVSTHEGVQYKNNDLFKKVDKGANILSASWDLCAVNINGTKQLLSISNAGVHRIHQNKPAEFLFSAYAYRLEQSVKDPKRVFVGLDDGLKSMYYKANEWVDEGYLLKTNYTAFNITQKNDLIILGDDPQGFYTELKCDQSNEQIKYLWHKTYDHKNQLPVGMVVPEGDFVGTDKGIYQKIDTLFKPINEINELFPVKNPYIHRLKQDFQGNYWVVVQWTDTIKGQKKEKQQVGYLQKTISGWHWITDPFLELSKGKIDAITHVDSFVTYLGGTNGLYVYDKREEKPLNQQFKVSVAGVETLRDHILLFGGVFVDQNNRPIEEQPEHQKLNIAYTNNSLKIDFASDNFEPEMRYAYKIEPLDQTYNEFSYQNFTELKNLREGSYTIFVKAKSPRGAIAFAKPYSFTILPPWYRTWWAYLLYFLLTAIIAFSIFFVWTKNLRTQVNLKTKEVVTQKEIIEEKNKDITQSIAYAEKIQRSLLPSEKLMQTHLNDHFVLFKPRDVVSGDFYWAAKQGNCFYFALMDCTGHGVPGAFMSMIGNAGLNELVLEKKLQDPGEILNALRINIIKALSQDGTTANRDGMDGVLCKLNTDSQTLEYAAANNSLFVLRSSHESLEYLQAHKTSTDQIYVSELKGQKMPIGYYPEKQEDFLTQKLKLKQGDRLYLTSDGLPDQFGGPKGKKFKKTNFLKLLTQLQSQSMSSQKQAIDQAFVGWMSSEHEQIDDVCVIGVKI